MDPNYKPYRTGMMTVLELEKGTVNQKVVCLSITYANATVERNSSSEAMNYPSILIPVDVLPNQKSHKHTMACMLKHTRAVYASCKSGVSGVTYNKKRKRWEAYITFQQVDHYLGSYKTKQGAIEARIEGEKKYFDPYISKEKNKKE